MREGVNQYFVWSMTISKLLIMWLKARYFTLALIFQASGASFSILYFGASFSILYFSILGQLTSPPQVAPPSTLSPQRTAGAISPQLSPSVGGLLSTNHLEGAQAQLQGEIKQFEEKYEDLVDDVLRAFKTGGVPITRVLKCLRQLPVSLKQQCGEFLQSQAARLSRVSNIDELFFILSLYWDFLNPNLLAHLSHRFGDDQIVRSVDEYLGELKEFRMRTKIDHFIDMWTGILSPDTQEIVMELGDNWREQSLEQLEELRIEVSRKRCFEDYVMPLKRIKLSSVDAVFSLPESVDIHNLELESLREFFQENQVLRILLNGVCIFNLQLQKVCSVCLCDHCMHPLSGRVT